MQESIDQLLAERGIQALILDLDGVITQTAQVHAQAWKKMFDAYLAKRAAKDGKTFQPLEIETDYRQYIDGIPRYDGVRNFLASRGIIIPEGKPDDEAGKETVAGLGNLKNAYFQELLQQGGVKVYADTVAWLEQQRKRGLRTAVISASKNCKAILEAARIEHLFDVRVDGVEAIKLHLKGKPAPDIFLKAAELLTVTPGKAAIFEDALAGVEAGKAGNFALVVGVDRTGDASELIKHGAEVILQKFPINNL
ncbi:beta-phosphoglucomutase family hydrolase [Pontibacter cellulosilyticus]|uniref:Beta-phosphoglucomutase n=1 Tax=Pontibacter cellulosilyticus TaxID=1720253 RepID=A0A923SH60_9BACT|nr:beta-phosphoglucomutase family hydrolase [Pontibacter cellulosilyticus]MBC5991343.1 beta-phosphoglucomutase family hydrolase [Pontibacter cellulosilyticus]